MQSRERPLLGPDTVTWRVNREPVVFMGGGRALLLQVAHPLVAAGVAQHSDYQRHPWKRLTPALLLWVWATLVDTSLTLYERCFGPLPAGDRERFYGEQQLFAHACGVPEGDCPSTFADFTDYLARMVADELRVTEPARAVRDAIAGAAVAAPLRPLLAPHTLITAGLLPPRLRAQYGFEWGPARQRSLDAWLALSGAAARAVPRAVRELPVGFVASRRA
jgi:uncharacterized protein (DUF2236 family)